MKTAPGLLVVAIVALATFGYAATQGVKFVAAENAARSAAASCSVDGCLPTGPATADSPVPLTSIGPSPPAPSPTHEREKRHHEGDGDDEDDKEPKH